jgi:hypothetical protein
MPTFFISFMGLWALSLPVFLKCWQNSENIEICQHFLLFLCDYRLCSFQNFPVVAKNIKNRLSCQQKSQKLLAHLQNLRLLGNIFHIFTVIWSKIAIIKHKMLARTLF